MLFPVGEGLNCSREFVSTYIRVCTWKSSWHVPNSFYFEKEKKVTKVVERKLHILEENFVLLLCMINSKVFVACAANTPPHL